MIALITSLFPPNTARDYTCLKLLCKREFVATCAGSSERAAAPKGGKAATAAMLAPARAAETTMSRFHWPMSDDAAALPVDVHWNPRRRTRMAISFSPGGAVRVEAPPGTTLDEVRGLLSTHERWVRYRSRAAAENAVYWYPAEYEDGAVLFLRGRPLVLRLGSNGAVQLRDGELLAPKYHAKRAVWAWYSIEAGTLLAQVVETAAATLPWVTRSPPWRHRYMKSRWGSCSSSGRVSLNTHLVKLPQALIEYVVLHEFCHLQHMNHGRQFYDLLCTHLPEWKDLRRELGHHVGLLSEPPP